MSNIIYCKNKMCPYYVKLETPVQYKPNARFVPLVEDIYGGECIVRHADMGCMAGWRCFRGCLFANTNEMCVKKVVFVDKTREGRWECKCQSDPKISGHKDWFQNLNPDGTPKGGHIDDDYAEKMNRDKKVNKSYSDHLRQKS